MALTLLFADSFAHYNDTSLKWSTGGGVFDVTPARVRTGPQSLRIQDGDSPILTPFFPLPMFTVGVAWQTSVLSGEIIYDLIDSVSGESQLFLVQLASGAIEVRTGPGAGVLIGRTAAGILTPNVFWYIELTARLNPGFLVLPRQVILTVTSAAGVPAIVLNISGFVTSQVTADTLVWHGPVGADHAWIADFYLAEWDGVGDSVYGAPKIYGAVFPIADGPVEVWEPPFPAAPFSDSAAPWFSQVAAQPQNTASFISLSEPVDPSWPPVNQSFQFDVSAVPASSAVAAVQVACLWAFEAASIAVNFASVGAYAGYTGALVTSFQLGQGLNLNPLFSLPILNPATLPFFFYCTAFTVNPVTGFPWVLAEFSGATPLLLGPATIVLI
jgi:hypothetical protein